MPAQNLDAINDEEGSARTVTFGVGMVAGAIALINSIGNLAGFGGPYLIGWIKDSTGSTANGLLALSVLPLLAGLLVFLGRHESKVEFVARSPAE